MSKLLSFIFSSDTLDLKDKNLKGFFAAIFVVIVLFSGAELFAHKWLEPYGNYWQYWGDNAGVKFEYYRSIVKQENFPDILIVGDSTAARDLSPKAMTDSILTGADVFNLGYPANFPMAYRCTTIPLLDTGNGSPELVIMQISPSSLIDAAETIMFEQGILTSPICRKQNGETLAGDYFHLARFWQIFKFRSAWNTWWKGTPPSKIPPLQGFMPLEPDNKELKVLPIKETPVSFSSDRFSIIIETADIINKNGGRLIVVIPPFFGNYRKAEGDYYLKLLQETSIDHPFLIIDGRDTPGLDASLYSGYVHLNKNGADAFSKYIAGKIVPLISITP